MKALHLTRCPWLPLDDDMYVRYHDEEWGVPVHDDRLLFEMLILEGAQAGLSWKTVLHKRERYREVFAGFDPEKIVQFTPKKIEHLMSDPGIIRNRLKIESTIRNARAYLAMMEEGLTLDRFLWDFVQGAPIRRRPRSMSEYRTSCTESDQMSKALKRRGFNFIGTTICYAFMQAVGMVDEHASHCFCAKS